MIDSHYIGFRPLFQSHTCATCAKSRGVPQEELDIYDKETGVEEVRFQETAPGIFIPGAACLASVCSKL
jgi:hypothetical protein